MLVIGIGVRGCRDDPVELATQCSQLLGGGAVLRIEPSEWIGGAHFTFRSRRAVTPIRRSATMTEMTRATAPVAARAKQIMAMLG